jgi:hypothetical protein
MNASRDTVARSRNHFSNGNTTMQSAWDAELHVTVSYIKILSVAQQCL